MTGVAHTIPSVPGFSDSVFEGLRPYQCEGVRFLAERSRAMLLDEQGLGKTVMAIRAADAANLMSVVTVGPAISRTVWTSAFRQWAQELHHVTALSYDFFSRKRSFDALKTFDLLILDEAHCLKEQSSSRTAAIYGHLCRGGANSLISRARRVWLLSGTITPNGPHELYTHLRALWPEIISWSGRPALEWEFLSRYFHCSTDWFTQRVVVRGPKREMIGELREKVAPLYLRRLKRDVLKDLPPLTIEVTPLSHSSKETLCADDRQAIERAISAAEMGAECHIPFATLRRMTGEAKIRASLEYIKNELSGGCQKIIVFAHHRDVMQMLADGLSAFGLVQIHGGVPDREREAAVQKFQVDPAIRVFLGQIQACKEAITLTAADRVVFVEFSPVPGDNAQAAARAHRIGTTNAVLASMLTLAGSLDEKLLRVVHRKTKAIAALWQS